MVQVLDITRLRTRFQAMAARMPVTFTAPVGGTSYVGTRSVVNLERMYIDPGRIDQYRFTITVPYANLATPPAINSLLTYDSTTWRVLGIERDSGDISFHMHLGEAYPKDANL